MSIKPETETLMTPQGGTLQDYAFREAPYVFYRKGTYYFLWSVDATGSPNYHVAYGTAKSPLGPIEVAKNPVILIQRPEQEIYGPAHNAVLNRAYTAKYVSTKWNSTKTAPSNRSFLHTKESNG